MQHVLQYLAPTLPALPIICTAGPSVYEVERVDGRCQIRRSLFPDLLRAGMRIVRINFSHVQPEDYEEIKCLISHIRKLEEETKQPIPILMDLKGPEIRIVSILDSKLKPLAQGKSIRVKLGKKLEVSTHTDTSKPLDSRAHHRLVVSFDGDFYSQMIEGETVVIGDNELSLVIIEKVAGGVLCVTEGPGRLRAKKGLNLPKRRRLEAPVLVANDIAALKEGFDVDLIAQSFVNSASDASELHGFLGGIGLADKPIIAKIETPAAVHDIDAILRTPGVFGIMVARGDLGALEDFSMIPEHQEELIDAANLLGKPVIVATQMLETMINNPSPGRSDVTDIRTAIKEGADALMLSGETAVGNFPVLTVSVMATLIKKFAAALKREEYLKKFGGEYAAPNPDRPIDVLGFAICEVADEAGSPFILSYATTGITATLISRLRPRVPVIAITNRQDTARKLCLLCNVYPVLVNKKALPREPQEFIKFLREIVADLGLGSPLKSNGRTSSPALLVGTQELTGIIGRGKGQGIFVFEP